MPRADSRSRRWSRGRRGLPSRTPAGVRTRAWQPPDRGERWDSSSGTAWKSELGWCDEAAVRDANDHPRLTRACLSIGAARNDTKNDAKKSRRSGWIFGGRAEGKWGRYLA